MCSTLRKRSKSLDSISSFSKFHSPKLIWSDWTDISFLNHFNLIDYEYKKNSFKTIPWFNVPFYEKDITQYCIRSIYNIYRPYMMHNIAYCNDEILPSLVQKLLYVSKLFNIVSDADETSCLYYNIVYSLFDKGSEDPSLLLTIWKTLCVPDRTKVAVLSGVIGKHRKRKSAKLLRYIIGIAHSVRFDFWGAWTKGHKLQDFNYCPVTAALLSGNIDQMSILLQYGFEPNSQRLYTYDKHFFYYVNCIYDWLKQPLVVKESSERKKTITEVLLFLVNTVASSSQLKRISMSNCFRLLWSVLPTPYVTKEELENEVRERFLHPPNCSRISYFPTTESQFLMLCDYYAAFFFGEDYVVYEPRSLKHLCKYTIRSQMQKCWTLPMGINGLPLPNHLKSYLHLKAVLSSTM